MDLHFTDAVASAEEKTAIDGFVASLPAEGDRRQYLIETLHATQDRIGWISPGALNHTSKVLGVPPAEAYGVADFYALFSTVERPPVVAHVCDDIGCMAKGAEKLCADLTAKLGPAGTSKDGHTTWHRSPCLGLCERAPVALVVIAGKQPQDHALAATTVAEIEKALQNKPVPEIQLKDSVPQFGQPGLQLLKRVGVVDPESIDDYRAHGGFQAMRRAFEMEIG